MSLYDVPPENTYQKMLYTGNLADPSIPMGFVHFYPEHGIPRNIEPEDEFVTLAVEDYLKAWSFSNNVPYYPSKRSANSSKFLPYGGPSIQIKREKYVELFGFVKRKPYVRHFLKPCVNRDK